MTCCPRTRWTCIQSQHTGGWGNSLRLTVGPNGLQQTARYSGGRWKDETVPGAEGKALLRGDCGRIVRIRTKDTRWRLSSPRTAIQANASTLRCALTLYNQDKGGTSRIEDGLDSVSPLPADLLAQGPFGMIPAEEIRKAEALIVPPPFSSVSASGNAEQPGFRTTAILFRVAAVSRRVERRPSCMNSSSKAWLPPASRKAARYARQSASPSRNG